MTALKISQMHFGKDLDPINSFLALSEVVAHLVFLEKQDKVRRIERNGKYLFTC